MQTDLHIREAAPADIPALLQLYAPYVRHTAVTFEYEVPTQAEFLARMEAVQRTYPYLVAEQSGRIVGYAYASPFVGRAAYDWSVELSIYVDEGLQHTGIGGSLYWALEACLSAMGIQNLNACIGYPETEDAYLTTNSADFHRHMGYRLVGRFHKCGFKFGRWYDMIWMEKWIGNHPGLPRPVLPFSEVRAAILTERRE